MQSNISSEQITYGVQLWKLGCLYFDGRDYRFDRRHTAVDPGQRGRIAVTVNRALKRRFATPGELSAVAREEGTAITMPPIPSHLRGLLPRGATVSTFVTSESRTGASCRLLVFVVVQGEIIPLAHSVAAALGLETYSDQIILASPRAKAGAELVARLGRELHGDPAALRHHSIGEVRA